MNRELSKNLLIRTRLREIGYEKLNERASPLKFTEFYIIKVYVSKMLSAFHKICLQYTVQKQCDRNEFRFILLSITILIHKFDECIQITRK